jgi:hypothetical protein
MIKTQGKLHHQASVKKRNPVWRCGIGTHRKNQRRPDIRFAKTQKWDEKQG